MATHLECGSRTARGPWPDALAIVAANCRRRRAVSRFLAYAPATVWAALLLFLGGRSDVPTADTPLPLDKAAHFLLYGLLGVLATWGWQQAGRRPHLLLPLILAVAVGAADELHQRDPVVAHLTSRKRASQEQEPGMGAGLGFRV